MNMSANDPAPASSAGISAAEADEKSQEALLAMGERWEKEGRVHHAVDAYTRVISLDPASAAARVARQALIDLAEQWRRNGKEYSAANLYHLLARYYR